MTTADPARRAAAGLLAEVSRDGAAAGLWVKRLVLTALYALVLGTVAYFAIAGRSYYLAPLAERARHPLYWQLKPGGTLGLRFGIAGAGMMVLMLAYSLRKRLAALRRWGPIGAWLDGHILLGICGPAFILLHSSFKVGGLVSLSFWSMVAVALSGIVGRYLYRLIPHTASGEELSLAEVERQDDTLSLELVEAHGVEPREVAALDAWIEQRALAERSLPGLLLALPAERWALRRQIRGLVRSRRRAGQRELAALVRRKVQLRLRIALWGRVRQLFHHWHVFHKPFALIMYLFMVVHVVVAWMTGYAWVRP